MENIYHFQKNFRLPCRTTPISNSYIYIYELSLDRFLTTEICLLEEKKQSPVDLR